MIAIVTKCDSLEVRAISMLRAERKMGLREARLEAPRKARELLEREFLDRLETLGLNKTQVVKLSSTRT